jgi:hypothetical protein
MRRERFARPRRSLLAGAWVAAIVQLAGCAAHVTALSPHTSVLRTDPLDIHFPPAPPEGDDNASGPQFTTCPLTSEETQSFLRSFLYHAANTAEEIAPTSQKQFSIEACYRAEYQSKSSNGTWRFDGLVAIVADDTKHSDDVVDVVVHHLVYFENQVKVFEISYNGSYYASYGIAAIPAAGESNPLVLVRRNEGGNSRDIIYELYRVEVDGLRRLWQWEKGYIGGSTAMSYSISNLDFSEITSSDHKRFTVYTTYGQRREFKLDTNLTPKHRVTSFRWNPIADAFVEERRRSLKDP